MKLSDKCSYSLSSDGKYYWDMARNPRLVKVYGVTYFGCSDQCARVLFMIHHQYALRKEDL
jgi:hypothetical protein